jgi:hypothetical protein
MITSSIDVSSSSSQSSLHPARSLARRDVSPDKFLESAALVIHGGTSAV